MAEKETMVMSAKKWWDFFFFKSRLLAVCLLQNILSLRGDTPHVVLLKGWKRAEQFVELKNITRNIRRGMFL